MIAGFVQPTGGAVLLNGQDVTQIPPYRRDIGLVFQNYALFPHLTVAENVAFGLRNIGTHVSERDLRVREVLDMVQLATLSDRYPRQLSGGQQQRVALARVLAIRPSLLLLDEPFSNLDANLRITMRDELKDLIRRLQITTVFVTHDQEEALALADRIVVMQLGQAEQVGSPYDIYKTPVNRFVAEFIGLGNFLSGRVIATQADGIVARTNGGLTVVAGRAPATLSVEAPVTIAVRPEAITLSQSDDAGPNAFRGQIKSATYLGAVTRYRVTVGRDEILVELHSDGSRLRTPGEAVAVRWSPHDAIVLT
jgi:putative spermidine/putrescine transport system ATP-binding protein